MEWAGGGWGVIVEGSILVEITIKYFLSTNCLFSIARINFNASSPCARAEEENATWMKVLVLVGVVEVGERGKCELLLHDGRVLLKVRYVGTRSFKVG